MSWFDDNEHLFVRNEHLFKKKPYRDMVKRHIRDNVRWKTKDGSELLFDEMNSRHIVNCMKLLYKRMDKYDLLMREVFSEILKERRYEISRSSKE